MARVLAAFLLGLAIGAACITHGEEEPSESTISWAEQVGIDPWDLAGALNTIRVHQPALGAEDYLMGEGLLERPEPEPVQVGEGVLVPPVVRVRLTYYAEGGVTYGGGHTFPGSTACSWNFRIGTRFRLPDGEVFLCNDRGLLGSVGWLDLWRRSDLVRKYGPYVTVEVLVP